MKQSLYKFGVYLSITRQMTGPFRHRLGYFTGRSLFYNTIELHAVYFLKVLGLVFNPRTLINGNFLYMTKLTLFKNPVGSTSISSKKV